MPIALDFGTSNTIIARWNAEIDDVELIETPELSRRFEYVLPGDAGPGTVPVYPSLIHYGKEQALGAQVEAAGLTNDPATFRWLKMDMLRQNKRSRRVGEERISYAQAATELVSRFLVFASQGGDFLDEDLVLTVPVEAYDHYVEWLTAAAGTVYQRGVHVVDEATACVLGYTGQANDGDLFLIVDFGGGTLDVSLVRTDFAGEDEIRKCRVLGRAGEEIGGMLIDQWMLDAMDATEDELRSVGVALLQAVETAKITLTYEEQATVSVFCEASDRLLTRTFSRDDFKDILTQHRFFETVAGTVDRAIEQGQDRYGVKRSEIRQVLLVGGTSLIPAVQDQFGFLFPGKARCDNPFAAIAAGACRFVEQNYDPAIVHEYCLKNWDEDHKSWNFTTVIPKGTRYPTVEPVKALYINSTYDGQDRLGLLLYENSDMLRMPASYVVASDGRLQRSDEQERRIEKQQPLNPENREFILADPPCKRGERRFAAAFGVDEQKRLTISLRDLNDDGKSVVIPPEGDPIPLPVENYPVTRLSR